MALKRIFVLLAFNKIFVLLAFKKIFVLLAINRTSVLMAKQHVALGQCHRQQFYLRWVQIKVKVKQLADHLLESQGWGYITKKQGQDKQRIKVQEDDIFFQIMSILRKIIENLPNPVKFHPIRNQVYGHRGSSFYLNFEK